MTLPAKEGKPDPWSLLDSCIDLVREQGLIADLPEPVRDYALARPDAAKNFFRSFVQGINKLEEVWGDETSPWKDGYNLDDRAACMVVDMLPVVEQLAKLPGSEELVFDAMGILWRTSIGENLGHTSSGYGGLFEFLQTLDDESVLALVRLWKTGSVPCVHNLIEEFEKFVDHRVRFGSEGASMRTLECLEGIARTPTLIVLARKTLSGSRLPAETIAQVERELFNLSSVTHPVDMESTWGMKRPHRMELERSFYAGRFTGRGKIRVEAKWNTATRTWTWPGAERSS